MSFSVTTPIYGSRYYKCPEAETPWREGEGEGEGECECEAGGRELKRQMLMLYAACSQRLSSSLMATKPQRLHQNCLRSFSLLVAVASGASILGSGKKQRAMTTSTATADSPMREEFAKYTDYLNQLV
ncbi:hypothetical protein BHE74_00002622 [Ensete ventricosum]|nr:hypothetical protein GW17_00011262 [Ensete ventricosum]RWW88499.1 hypothetical protein BHE74_00002622 [Ensete ventricosum]